MRTSAGAPISKLTPGRAAMLAALFGVTGCATLRATLGAYDVGRNGISRPQQDLRDALARQDFASALGWEENDSLLRQLNAGVSRYYASQFAQSAAVLDSAALLADDRITASLGRDALALVTNDLARPYQPHRTERLFIAYYGMLSYVKLAQWEDAAVEARRLSSLLAQYAADRTDAERPMHATLHYLAGAVFERAGDQQDASVSYRNARALALAGTDTAPVRAAKGEGDVLLVVERGFVAHRATETINVLLGDSERDSLRYGDHATHSRTAASIAERIARAADDGNEWGRSGHNSRHKYQDKDADGDDEDYWLSIAFPVVRRSPHVRGETALLLDGASVTPWRVVTLLDDAVAADERRERAAVLTRAVARVATKFAITKKVKDDKGDVAGQIANIGASLLERADVRSWHLLPQEITVLRIHAPAGERRLQLSIGDGADARHIELPPITVRPGVATIASVRVWRDPDRWVVATR